MARDRNYKREKNTLTSQEGGLLYRIMQYVKPAPWRIDTEEFGVRLDGTSTSETLTPNKLARFIDVENLNDTYHLILTLNFNNGQTTYITVSPESGYKQVFPNYVIESAVIEAATAADVFTTNTNVVDDTTPSRVTTGAIAGPVDCIVRFINT